MKKVNWKLTCLYYGLACLWSWPFFWWRDVHSESWKEWAIPQFLKNWSIMWGPALSALIVLFLFKASHKRRITLFGNSFFMSTMFVILPILYLSFFGLENEQGKLSHFYPLIIIGISLISTFGEEMGWRGFLQDNLNELRPWKKYVLIGVLWEFWHFTTRTQYGEPFQICIRLLISYPTVILLSFLIGWVTERTKSILVATTLHLWINLTFQYGNDVLLPLSLSLVSWFVLLLKWNRQQKKEVVSNYA